MNEPITEPLLSIYAVSKQRGLLPTWAFSDKAGGFVAVAPYRWCQLDSAAALAGVFSSTLAAPVKEVDLSFEEAMKTTEIEHYLGLHSGKELERKTVSITISVESDKFDVHALGRAASGGWDYNEPYALKLDIPREKGMEALAQAVVDHIQSRKDLPDERVIGVSPSIAKGA
ncbi:MAG: hypothetical protein C0464_02225 [Cyanobacteria bacterium DS2.008]|nr:hypothetical protein [Cyanobacteria bacterium DS2.008]